MARQVRIKPEAPKSGGVPAKPKAKAKKPAWDASNYSNAPAAFFGAHLEENQAKSGGASYLGGKDAELACIGIPLTAFSLQYLYNSNVYLLGRMEMTIGESDSCKSAFLFERGRWFLEAHGAFNYQLNEARDPAELRSSIIGDELLEPGRGYSMEGPCSSLENWQRNITAILKRYERTFAETGGCTFPAMIGLDSITGTTNEKVIEKIDKEGCAQITFGQDANLLNQYAKYLFQRLYRWPVSFVCTNHIKFGTDNYGNRVMRIPGGDELRYVSTYITLLKWDGKVFKRADAAGGRTINIKMKKAAGDHRQCDVDFVWTYDTNENGKQYSYWDWHRASAQILISAQLTTSMRKDLDDACHISDVNAGYGKCARLGLKKSTPLAEIGKALMDDDKVLKAVQGVFGIPRRAEFRPGVSYSQQIREAIEAGSAAAHSAEDAEGVAPDSQSVELEEEKGGTPLEGGGA